MQERTSEVMKNIMCLRAGASFESVSAFTPLFQYPGDGMGKGIALGWCSRNGGGGDR